MLATRFRLLFTISFPLAKKMSQCVGITLILGQPMLQTKCSPARPPDRRQPARLSARLIAVNPTARPFTPPASPRWAESQLAGVDGQTNSENNKTDQPTSIPEERYSYDKFVRSLYECNFVCTSAKRAPTAPQRNHEHTRARGRWSK